MNDKIASNAAADTSALSLAKISHAELKQRSPETIAKLTHICETLGFFIITDHDIPHSVIRRSIDASRDFFGLSEEVKVKYHQNEQVVTPKTSRGYSAKGEEVLSSNGEPDNKQFFELGIDRPLKPGTYF
eukprot:CAMPEP_0202455598 /NCGR_PEP_ID=MMETSP1360-20130828/13085_1 /ASSEMBLY_ACC=CAM_ASM_000848 /TAXON_ID=515479 /ORGANISM="Licmophora paradoxa, Strain CCMP2313" /LENGTH=129 /DNA_ID=CAMNT_0049075207 /DNA_START=125 /DNA_END=511 /DNA_ORIENTATION=+